MTRRAPGNAGGAPGCPQAPVPEPPAEVGHARGPSPERKQNRGSRGPRTDGDARPGGPRREKTAGESDGNDKKPKTDAPRSAASKADKREEGVQRV